MQLTLTTCSYTYCPALIWIVIRIQYIYANYICDILEIPETMLTFEFMLQHGVSGTSRVKIWQVQFIYWQWENTSCMLAVTAVGQQHTEGLYLFVQTCYQCDGPFES